MHEPARLQVAYGQDVGSQRPPRRGASNAASQAPSQATPSAPQWGTGPHGGESNTDWRARQGVAYDEGTGQFLVQGRPYGAYQFEPSRGYFDPRR